MKKQEGISMIALIVTIIVIVILSATAYIVSNDGFATSRRARYENEIKEIEVASTARFGDYCQNSTAYPLIGISMNLENKTNSEIVDEIVATLEKQNRYIFKIEETDIESENVASIESFVNRNSKKIEYTRILNPSDLTALGLKSVSGDASYSYLINYYSSDVVGPFN